MQYCHYLYDNIIISHCYLCNTSITYVITLKVVIGVHAIPSFPLYYISSSNAISSSFIIYLNILIFSLVLFVLLV
jgi:hypothetical protein